MHTALCYKPVLFTPPASSSLILGQVPAVCKVSGHLLELVWGYLLGEPTNATCRRDGWGAAGPPPGASRSPRAAARRPHAQPRRAG